MASSSANPPITKPTFRSIFAYSGNITEEYISNLEATTESVNLIFTRSKKNVESGWKHSDKRVISMGLPEEDMIILLKLLAYSHFS